MNIFNKKLINLTIFIIFFTVIIFFACSETLAEVNFEDISGLKDAGQEMGYEDTSIEAVPIIVGNIINVILVFIGIIFMVLIWLGAFDIISSAGNEEQVKKGKDRIKNGAIGILIVFAAYLFAKFILSIVSGGATPIFNI